MAEGFATNGNMVITGSVDTGNSTTAALNASATFTGTGKDVSSYPCVVVSCKTDQAGSLYVDFSTDNSNWDSTLTFSVAASTNEVHRLSVSKKYCRVRFTNTSVTNQTYLRLQTLLGSQPHLTAALNSTVSSDADSLVTRSVLMGQTDSGSYQFVPVTPEGHIEVAVHAPRLPFGSLHTEKLTPVFQSDAVYGVNAGLELTKTSGTGTSTASDSNFVVTTGTTANSFGSMQSRKRLRYRAGQGIVGRFTGLFTSPVANSYQVVGLGHAEDGLFFGYNGTQFGILHSQRGVREVRTLTITTASTTNENVTVQLNGVNNTVAVTNSGNIQRTVWELSQGTYTGWDAYPSGATVVFVRNAAGTASGSYSLTASTAIGSFAQTKAGAASTDTWVAQSSWNGDTMDGTGLSGITLDPTKYNVFQIGVQYLGAGAITFQIEGAAAGNNPEWYTVHTLRLPNTPTTTSLGNPALPFTMAATSAGSTTNLTVKCACFSGFIEGQKVLQGNRFSYINTSTSVGSANYQALFTVMNTRYYAGRTNQAVINLLSVSGALKHTSPCIFYLIRNGSLSGNPNFSSYSTNSCSLYDSSATTVTFSTNDQLVWTGHLGDTGELDHHFGNGEFNAEEVTLQPGEWITLAAKSVTGTPSYVTGSLNTREDQ